MDKPRNPRRGFGGRDGGPERSARMGDPGVRPKAFGRPAGQPGKAPAEGRRAPVRGGLDAQTIERLEKEGLLTKEGRRYFGEQQQGGRPGGRFVSRKQADPAEAPRRPRPVGEGRGPKTEAKLAPIKPRRGAAAVTRHTAPESLIAERLQKVMAQAGVASRRHSEELIQAGRVTVNGKVVTELGTKVVPGKDIVEVDGRPLGKAEDVVYIMLNKPKGYVTTLYDPQGRPKVIDLLGGEVGERVYPVGRLDYDTEGLLLLTNDGQLANALMHPAREIKKTYIAKVRGVPGPAKLRALEEGIELEDGPTAPADVKLIDVQSTNASTVSIRIHEGRNRQVRRMFEAVGHEVIHLRRTTLGPLHIKDLPVGQWRSLTEQELRDLRSAVGMKPSRAEKVAQITERRKAAGRRGAARFAAQGESAAVAPRRFAGRKNRSPK